jgi:hypothetical protein
MDIARDDSELFVVTENGYGKRTAVAEYPVKGRGTKGVLTAKLTPKKGGLAGALIVREHQDLLFISETGMVQRTRAGGISKMGRATQGVRVMNVRDDDRVSAVALVVESSAPVEENGAFEDGGEPLAVAADEPMEAAEADGKPAPAARAPKEALGIVWAAVGASRPQRLVTGAGGGWRLHRPSARGGGREPRPDRPPGAAWTTWRPNCAAAASRSSAAGRPRRCR